MAGNTHNFIVSSIISNFFPEKVCGTLKKYIFIPTSVNPTLKILIYSLAPLLLILLSELSYLN